MSYPTIYIRGMMEIDDKYDAMISLKNACEEADVDYPQELVDYFDRHPDESDYELKIGKFGVDILAFDGGDGRLFDYATDLAFVEILAEHSDMTRVYDIHLDQLPQALKTLRVEINW